MTEIVVGTDVKNRLQSGALKRRLLTLSEGTVILSIRDPDITTIGDINLADERERLAMFGVALLLIVGEGQGVLTRSDDVTIIALM